MLRPSIVVRLEVSHGIGNSRTLATGGTRAYLMKLIHRTNYWGTWIDSSDLDDDVPFDVIWTQAVRDNDGPCCHGFGRRSVQVTNSDFVDDCNDWRLVARFQG